MVHMSFTPGTATSGSVSQVSNGGKLGGRLVLILSPERSGSTLLSFMLGGHSRIIAPPEMHLLAYPDFDAWRQGYPQAMKSLCFLMESLNLPSEEIAVEKEFAGWTPEAIYRRLLAQCEASRFIVDKTPQYSRNLAILQRAETLQPFYIWLIRHPLAVAASQIDLQLKRRRDENVRLIKRLKYPLFRVIFALLRRREARRQIAYWADLNERLGSFLAGIPDHRRFTVYYEQLVRDPRGVMTGLCKALELGFEPAMLDPRANIPSSLEGPLGDGKILERKTIDPTAADSWRTTYYESLLDQRTLDLMRKIGVVTSAGLTASPS
jgi:sulfotransferase family protein